MAKFNIGKDFNPDPAGRFYKDGNGNGEDFRENYLKPRIEKLMPGEKLEILLDDDVKTYGSSFLTSGFAGMVKYGYIDSNRLLDILVFKFTNSEFQFFVNQIHKYIREAKFASDRYVPSPHE